MIQQLFQRIPLAHRQFIIFCSVGLVGFMVDAGSLSVLKRGVGLDPVIARIISEFVIAMTVTWQLNRNLTFRDRRDQPLWQEYLRFAMANGVGNLANLGTYTVLVKTVALFSRFPELATLVGTGVGVAFNFTGSKYFVFRRA